MPRAALCSRCGTYQWVNADGTCANGHSAECLTDYHEVPVPGYAAGPAVVPGETQVAERSTRARPRWMPSPLVALAVLALALVGVVAWSGITLVMHVDQVSSAVSQLLAPTTDEGTSSEGVATDSADDSSDTVDVAAYTTPLPDVPLSPAEVPGTRTTSNPNVAAPGLDAFIAKQYPGYRVEKRISFPSQWGQGRLGVNYLLVNEKHPKFRLLVNVAQLKPGEDPADPNEQHFFNNVGRVLTDDIVFSADALRNYGVLDHGAQDALVTAFGQKLPAGAFVYSTGIDGIKIDTSVGRGAKGLDRAMQDDGNDGSAGSGHAVLPVVPGRDVLTVDITFDNP
ncbi:MAG: hypothetical protein P4L93_06990 [Coriobacteriia bacterium]|nr:hypothetical protein [Coriobacteriia bacterium]